VPSIPGTSKVEEIETELRIHREQLAQGPPEPAPIEGEISKLERELSEARAEQR
jgi:uncharacterized protein (DUF3084 family)